VTINLKQSAAMGNRHDPIHKLSIVSKKMLDLWNSVTNSTERQLFGTLNNEENKIL